MKWGRAARGRRLIAVVPVLLVPIAAAGTGSTLAAFTGETVNAGNVVSAKPDWTAPTISESKIILASGKVPGTIRPGQTYYVYANASDDGSPPSGVNTVVANVSNLTTGANNVSLVAGSYTVGATTYGWRSALLTADAGLAHGSYTYSHQVADLDGNVRTQTDFPVSVDAQGPVAVDIQASGGAAGTPEQGDTIVYTFNEAIDPASVIAGWDGSARNIYVNATGTGSGPAANTRSSWALYDNDGSTPIPMGTFVGHAHIKRNNTSAFGGVTGWSTMTVSGATVTVTLGVALSPANVQTSTTAFALTWTPTAAITDVLGNAASTATATETGASDIDF